MKVLYLYSDKTGIAKSNKKVEKLNNSLKEIYSDLTIKKTNTLEELEAEIRGSVRFFDVLIIAGGDGTLKFTVGVLMSYQKEDRPILGYIPTGTVNDGGKSFGVRGTVKQALNVLRNNHVDFIDVCKVNNEYFTFVCAAGAYSDISYVVKRGPKKVLGRLAYYFYAISQLFKRHMLYAELETETEKRTIKSPFIMVLNGKNVGGFPVNFHYSAKDGLVEVYATKPGPFNGLLHYAFFKMRTLKLKAKFVKITLQDDEYWCFDGERGDKKTVEINVLKQELKVIGEVKK